MFSVPLSVLADIVRTARRNQMQTRENLSRSHLVGSKGSKPEKSDEQPNMWQRMVVQKMGRYLSINTVQKRVRLNRYLTKGVSTISQFIWLTKHRLQNKWSTLWRETRGRMRTKYYFPLGRCRSPNTHQRETPGEQSHWRFTWGMTRHMHAHFLNTNDIQSQTTKWVKSGD